MGSGGAQGDAQAVGRYLKRIGLESGGSLADLVRAHLRNVPFENLDIWQKIPLSLDPDDLFDKIVARRRGGFCYELNGLFAILLERLGYRVARYSAQVIGEGRVGPPFDHLTLGVRKPGGGAVEQLVDVGFGEGPRRPMPMAAGAELDDIAGRWRLEDAASGGLRLTLVESSCKLPVGTGYEVDRTERKLEDFAEMFAHHQSSPDSPFTRGPRITRTFEGGRETLTETALVRWTTDNRETFEVDDFEKELVRFGVEL